MATKSYSLKVRPTLDMNEAKRTEEQLNGRFAKVAKKYGDEMQNQNKKTANDFSKQMDKSFTKLKTGWKLAAGALAAVVGAVMTNPIDKADEKLNEYLQRVDNIATRAGQWNVDPAKYYLASEVAQIAGVNQSLLDTALLRVADKLEAARTGKDSTLSDFTDAADVVDAFYRLTQTWRNLDPDARAASMADVLGTRQANAFAELVDTDWRRLSESVLSRSGTNAEAIRNAIERGGVLERQQATNRSVLRTQELVQMNRLVNSGTLEAQNQLEQAKQRQVLDDVSKYIGFAKTEIAKINIIQGTLGDIKDAVVQMAGDVATLAGTHGPEAQAVAQAKLKAGTNRVVTQTVEDLGAPKKAPKPTKAAESVNLLWGGGL